MKTEKTNLILPLKKDEVEAIKEGQVIHKVFSNPATFKPLFVFVANRKLTEKDLKNPIEAGCDVASVDLDKKSLEVIESLDACRFGFKAFDVVVVSEETHKKAMGAGK